MKNEFVLSIRRCPLRLQSVFNAIEILSIFLDKETLRLYLVPTEKCGR